jgi:L,D-peptidoglycan transpeptidase YkuD (ErfK/YbiS/YcfS/YnhG family)
LLDRSRDKAGQGHQRLRIQLRIENPVVAALPWELLYDRRHEEFLCLSTRTPVVRYVELPEVQQPLPVEPPLRILAMVSTPSDLPELDFAAERARMDEALAPLVADGHVEIRWLEDRTSHDLQLALLDGPWHVFHFIGHGSFDEQLGQGVLALCDDAGATHRLPATDLAVLLGDHDSIRLAVLNACEGARADRVNLFSSSATALVRRGTPAVVAMQYPISDQVAIELARTAYAALVSGQPIDAALGEARKAAAVGFPGSFEWATPVLFLRAPDGHIFDVQRPTDPPQDDSVAVPPETIAPSPREARDDLTRTTGYLLVDIKAYRCALGYGGVSLPGAKREGDGTVPGGPFPLRQVLYRADRQPAPATRLPVRELDPTLVWCDDPTCTDYNQLVSLPHAGGYEVLWRDDNVYDLLAVVGYNDDPVVPGAGSAIFVHIARPGLTPTTGCIGVAIDDLLELLEYVNPGAAVTAVSNPA